MAYQKIYSREYWENFPSEKTAINRDRLNNIEGGIDAIDDRVCALDTTKVDLTKANELVEEILWDESNGTLTVVKMNGSRAVIDTKLEKLAVNFTYNPQTQQLVITLDDGTVQNVDLSSLITEYEFLDSDTIAFEITDGKVKAIVKNGSITEDHLSPDYLGEIRTQVGRAEMYAKSADASEKSAVSSSALSKSYAVGGTGTREGEDTDNAKYYAEQAKNASDVGALSEIVENHISNKTIHMTESEHDVVSKLGESSEGSLTYNGNEITSKADSELSTTSENPVQNKIITVKLNEKADSMVYDESNSKLKLMNGETVLSEVTVSGVGSDSGATIGVLTYESTLIGKEVVLSKDGKTVKTGKFSVGGICTFSGIEEPGTYSLYSTDGIDSNTITVDVTAENVINKTVISCDFYLTPYGETVTPVDDVAILLKCAEIKDKSYTTMDELLADEQAMGDITMSENAMKYLARSTSFADAVCANETFMTLLGQSAYVDATVLNSDLWLSAVYNSSYFEHMFSNIKPYMTSNSTPYNMVSAGANTGIMGYLPDGSLGGSTEGTQYAYCGFTTGITYIYAKNTTTPSVIYTFDSYHYIKSINIYIGAGNELASTGINIYLDGALSYTQTYSTKGSINAFLNSKVKCKEIKFELLTTKRALTGFQVYNIIGR